MGSALGDDHVVEPDVAAFLGYDVGQIGILADAVHRVARVHDPHGRAAVDELHLDVVRKVRANEGLLRNERFLRCQHIRRVTGVDVFTQHLERDADRIAHAVVHQNFAGILLVPERSPAVDGGGHHRGVVEDADRAPHIRNAVSVVRIERKVEEARIDIAHVRDVALVDGVEQVVRDQLFDNVVRGEAQIVNAVRRGELDEHLFVAGHGRILDRNAGLFFKLLKQGGVDIVAPVEYVQRGLAAAAAREKRKGQREHQGKAH
ncbi:hypothetical protein SDC9_122686 [bioreactor metagenome]|uniref:Uncharacterized protein n=1 Tax=bioreactor metagenome TaxID=1076179 RepID=A0A645CFR6_9ZZZZ